MDRDGMRGSKTLVAFAPSSSEHESSTEVPVVAGEKVTRALSVSASVLRVYPQRLLASHANAT